ncbi:aspC [Symbiodinium pilosum]|uniref:AspC protein n=1 Tax=Symbiodinium pilosum TaxID=2952 RepID=A0A812YP26_SYMPI|nr:aspC [Symbiodinium pilosum]
MAQKAVWRPRLAKRVLQIPGSGIREVMSKSMALRDAGKDVINWHIGRPDFDTPSHIKEACSEALRRGHVHYAPAAGLPQLRCALAKRASQEYAGDVDPERVVVCNGGMEAVTVILHTFLEEGDEVIVPTPNWPNMKWAVAMAGGKPVEVPLQQGVLTAKAIAGAVTHRTKFAVLSSPGNPLGTVTGSDELKRISKVLEEKDLMAISDETYTRLYYGGSSGSTAPSILGIKGMSQRCFAASTFSKTYAMDGWRLGWALCPDAEAAAAVAKTRYYFSACSPTFTQHAGATALSSSQDCVAEMVAEYDQRRSVLVEGLRTIPGLKLPGGSPEGAYYVFPDVSSFGDSAELASLRMEVKFPQSRCSPLDTYWRSTTLPWLMEASSAKKGKAISE